MSTIDLELAKLQKIYPGGTLAVESFDLQVEKGEFISFVGPSGCGKTTTLRMIAGLEGITSGNLFIKGRNYTNVIAEERPTATIFQNYAIFPHLSVYQNISFGLEVRGVRDAEIKKRVDDMIEKLELQDVAHAKDQSLSGGQKQRVALARGLITEPNILLLDEPLGALDANLRKSIQEELKILQRSLGVTFIFVTHSQEEALAMGDRVVVMNAGKVEQISAPFSLYTKPESLFVAKFIGNNKLLSGKITSIQNNIATISTKFGQFRSDIKLIKNTPSIQEEVNLVIPAEYMQIQLHSGDSDKKDSVSATIVGAYNIAQFKRVKMRLKEGFELTVDMHRKQFDEGNFKAGCQITLTWPISRTTIVGID